jgi:hypothetical protein
MLVSGRFVLMAWIMALLLLANSVVIIINIFNFPATGIRHLLSFVSALGIFSGLTFITLGILRLFGFPRQG